MAPPDEYAYHHQDGYVSRAKDQDTWLSDIRKHMRDNEYPIPENIEELAADQNCRTLPPGWCKYADGANQQVFINKRRGADDLARGMAVLIDVINPFNDPLVDEATANNRARICSSCPANVDIQGCLSCNNMAGAITQIRGSNRTESDSVLRSCAVCSCLNRAQVWVKAEHLAKGVTSEMMGQFESLPWCWKGKELRAL